MIYFVGPHGRTDFLNFVHDSPPFRGGYENLSPRAYVHACVHARVHACVHASVHACAHADVHACAHVSARVHASVHASAPACMHACAQPAIHIPTIGCEHFDRKPAGKITFRL